jgi:hypothetical protein
MRIYLTIGVAPRSLSRCAGLHDWRQTGLGYALARRICRRLGADTLWVPERCATYRYACRDTSCDRPACVPASSTRQNMPSTYVFPAVPRRACYPQEHRLVPSLDRGSCAVVRFRPLLLPPVFPVRYPDVDIRDRRFGVSRHWPRFSGDSERHYPRQSPYTQFRSKVCSESC